MGTMSYKKLFAIAALVSIFLPIAPRLNRPSLPVAPSSATISKEAPSHSRLPFSFSLQENDAFASSTEVQSSLATTPLSFFSCAAQGSAVTCAIYFISIFVNAVLSLFVALGAYLVRIGLSFNSQVFDSPSIQIGFGISLALANLGFVLGIIVIAIATIFRNQTYSIKNILWKLIVMAILVNFGLVITRPIVAFSQSISDYFLQSSVGDYNGATSGALDYANFVANITNAFAPQAYTANPPGGAAATSNSIYSSCSIPILGSLLGPAGPFGYTWNNFCSDISKLITGRSPEDLFWETLLSLVFSMVFVSLTALALIALAILLLVRYVYIGILLILLPLAWLAWVFPEFSSWSKKWWSKFIQWTFFPPLAIFFIYLAFQTAAIQANGKANNFINQITQPTPANNSNTPESTLAVAIGQTEPIQQAADGFVLIGLMIGGLFAASSLAGTAGSVAVATAKKGGNWVARKAKGTAIRQGKRAAAGAVPRQTMEKLQRGELMGGRFKRLQVATGIGLGNVQRAGGAALVDQEAAWAKQHAADPEEAKRLLGSGGISKQKQIALIKQLSDQKRLDNTFVVGPTGTPITDYFDTNKDELEKTLGQGKLSKDIDKTFGSDAAMRQRATELKLAKQTNNNELISDAQKKLDEASADFLSKKEKGDITKMNVNSVFGENAFRDNPELARAQLKAMVENQAQLLPSLLQGATGGTIKTIWGDKERGIQGEYDKIIEAVVEAERNSESFQKKKEDAGSNFKAEIEKAKVKDFTNELIIGESVQEKDVLDAARISGIGDIAAAQDAYNKKLDEARKKYIDSISQQQKQAEEELEKTLREDVEKRLGKDKLGKAIGLNAMSGSSPAPSVATEEKTTETKPVGK